MPFGFDLSGTCPFESHVRKGSIEMARDSKRRGRWGVVAALAAALVAVGAFAAAASAAVPQNTAAPTISGTAKEGSQLTASTGGWSNTPTGYAYQWQRCTSDGTGCGDITGATDKTYTPVTGDVSHTAGVCDGNKRRREGFGVV